MKKEFKNILVPVDFKSPSLKAINYALNMADRFKGEVILLHVLETPGLLSDFFSSSDSLVKLTDRAKEKLHEISRKQSETHPDRKSTRLNSSHYS